MKNIFMKTITKAKWFEQGVIFIKWPKVPYLGMKFLRKLFARRALVFDTENCPTVHVETR